MGPKFFFFQNNPYHMNNNKKHLFSFNRRKSTSFSFYLFLWLSLEVMRTAGRIKCWRAPPACPTWPAPPVCPTPYGPSTASRPGTPGPGPRRTPRTTLYRPRTPGPGRPRTPGTTWRTGTGPLCTPCPQFPWPARIVISENPRILSLSGKKNTFKLCYISFVPSIPFLFPPPPCEQRERESIISRKKVQNRRLPTKVFKKGERLDAQNL